MYRYKTPWLGQKKYRTKYKWHVGFAKVKPTKSWPGDFRQGLWRRSGKRKIWKFH